MLDFVDINKLRYKFAKLLSKLHNGLHLSLESINDKIVNSSFFDFFEDNQIEVFFEQEYSTIIEKMFGINMNDYGDEDIGPVYWAGLQYINIFLNYHIPIRQIFLLCPLDVMVGHYTIYHEMNEIELCKNFLEVEYKKSILKLLRNNNDLSIRQLSILSGISENTIRYYELDNKHLFNASNEAIKKLSNCLSYPRVFFKKESDFIPYSPSLIDDKLFLYELEKNVRLFYNLSGELTLTISNEKINNPFYLLLDDPIALFSGKKRIVIDNVLYKLFIQSSIKNMIDNFIAKERRLFY